MSNEMIPYRETALPPVRSFDDLVRLGEIMAKSGLFQDARDANKCVVKILAGMEMGFGPFASMADVHVIEGKPAIGAHLRAAAIKRSGRYDYRVVELTRERCELEFLERAGQKLEPVGRVAMTFQEAVDNGLAMTTDKQGNPLVKRNWRVHPDDMLFARCISKGYRRYCPDLTGSVLAYDPDEIDDGVRQDDRPADVTVVSVETDPPAQAPPPAAAAARITDAQAAELSALVRAGRVDVKAFLARYEIPVVAKLPAEHFEDARRWLRDHAAPAAADNKPAGPPATEFISRAQYDELNAVLKSRPEHGRLLMQAFGVARWGLLPADRLADAKALAAGPDADLETLKQRTAGLARAAAPAA